MNPESPLNDPLPPLENSSATAQLQYEIIDGTFKDKKVHLPAGSDTQVLYDKTYFGNLLSEGRLELEIIEALLLLERNRITLVDEEGHPLTAEQLLAASVEHDPDLWVRFLVYRDLRQRGYIVRMGYGEGIDFRLFPRGATQADRVAKHFVFILAEGNPVHLQKLHKITEQTLSARKQLILAIVDRLGDPTYYQLAKFNLPLNNQKEEKNLW